MWRNGGSPTPNSLADYTTWKANFGKTAGSGSGLGGASAVPEPASVALLLIGILLDVRDWQLSAIAQVVA